MRQDIQDMILRNSPPLSMEYLYSKSPTASPEQNSSPETASTPNASADLATSIVPSSKTDQLERLIDTMCDLVLRLERAVETLQRMPAQGLGPSEAELEAIKRFITRAKQTSVMGSDADPED